MSCFLVLMISSVRTPRSLTSRVVLIVSRRGLTAPVCAATICAIGADWKLTVVLLSAWWRLLLANMLVR